MLSLGSYLWVRIQLAVGLCLELDSIELEVGKHAVDIVEVRGLKNHADDLARACIAALWRGKPQRNTNVSDDTELKMGDYFDMAADLYGLPKPPRLSRSLAQQQLPLMLLSFMGESRRLDNRRLKQELGLRLRYPTVREGLAGS